MLSRRTLLASILVPSLLAAGCIRQITKTLSELKVVHDELAKKFGEDVYVHVSEGSGKVLTVTFINSVLNEQAPEQRAKRALEAAQIVKARYALINTVNVIWVGFVRQTSKLILFHYNQSVGFYAFDKNAQPLTNVAATGTQPTATYIRSSNESDISLNGVQLEGTPGGMGLTVLPHFKAAGDARTEKLRAPKEVSFDFASYSDKERFTGTVPIVFMVDGKPVVQAKRTFSTSKLGDTVSQFCYLPVPYPAFQRIVGGKYLTIKLGDTDYYLDREQFKALQQMDEYVDHR